MIVREYIKTGEYLHKKKFDEYTKTSEQYIAMIEDTIADNTFDFEQITALQEWEENIHSEVFDSYANRQRAQARANFQSLATDGERSEEHTSELQSRGHLVCRLLLEQKNHVSRCTTPMSS